MSKSLYEFELAVKAYSKDLYRYAYWLTKSPFDAEDLVQECFQKAWHGWKSLKDEKAVKKWLFVILRREFLRKIKKSSPDYSTLEDLQNLPIVQADCVDIVTLQRALQIAPIGLREPLLLQVLGGFSCDEIADMLNTSQGAVMTRLTRARQWFRLLLNGAQENEVRL